VKKCDETARTDYSGIEDSLKDVINAQILLGKEVLKLLGGAADGLRGISLPSLPKMKSCCDVPEPCWMPVALGEVECKLRPGDSGQVCLAITNHDSRRLHAALVRPLLRLPAVLRPADDGAAGVKPCSSGSPT
jgi:hypothetical protein